MDFRKKLVDDLLETGYIGSCFDYCQIATFLQCDYNKELILGTPELRKWPKAAAWLAERL